ncbi:MAG: hypothetical protein ABR600_08610 [Actinomycetota bacterium]
MRILASARGVSVGLALGAALLLTACDPYPVPDDATEAWIDVTIGAQGGGEIRVSLPPTRQRDLRSLTELVARQLFPRNQSSVSIDANDGGYSIGVARINDVYPPGRAPKLTVQAGEIPAILSLYRFERARLTICPPKVPAVLETQPRSEGTTENCLERRILSAGEGVVARIKLHPDPAAWIRWTADSVFSALALLASLWFYLRRNRYVSECSSRQR